MRFRIRFIVKEDDGSALRGDNKKIVSWLHIPIGIDSSTRTRFLFGTFEIGKSKMLFRSSFLLQLKFSRERVWAFELSPKNSSCGEKTAAYPEAYCKSLTHVTSRALPLSSKNQIIKLDLFSNHEKEGAVRKLRHTVGY